MIGLITGAADNHLGRATERLDQRGIRYVRFDPADFPSSASISMGYASTGICFNVRSANEPSVRLDELTAIWWRRPGRPIPSDRITDRSVRDYVAAESTAFLEGLWESLRCPCLPGRRSDIRRAEHKASQLRIAGEVGFEIPPTLFTNDPDQLLAFYREHSGQILTKPVSASDIETPKDAFARYADVVRSRDIGHHRTIRLCPVIAQAYMPKRVELRVTVVGERVFAAEIDSQASNHAKHDWRRYDLRRTPHRVHDLPQTVAECCVNLVSHMNLCYGAIDLILTPDGRYVFLEINPNGEYLWIEFETGMAISEAIADHLIDLSRSCRISMIGATS